MVDADLVDARGDVGRQQCPGRAALLGFDRFRRLGGIRGVSGGRRFLAVRRRCGSRDRERALVDRRRVERARPRLPAGGRVPDGGGPGPRTDRCRKIFPGGNTPDAVDRRSAVANRFGSGGCCSRVAGEGGGADRDRRARQQQHQPQAAAARDGDARNDGAQAPALGSAGLRRVHLCPPVGSKMSAETGPSKAEQTTAGTRFRGAAQASYKKR